MGSFEKLTISGCQYCKDDSDQYVFHVNSPHALMQAVGYIKHTANPWERVFIRGQSRLYSSLSPTLYRGIKTSASQDRRHKKLTHVIEEFSSASSLFKNMDEYAQEPLLQHYGIQTTWLDIVDNVWVALWFALHKANSSGPENQYVHFDTRVTGNDGDFGYIILIKTEDSRNERVRKGIFKGKDTEVIDLRIAAPSVFLRPHAQHGLLFRARGLQGGRITDYSNSIAGIIRFPLEAGKSWLGVGEMHNVRSLFPPPFYDHGYQILLGKALTERSLGLISHIGA